MRFGKVFQQTYTRFLDLQRAEAQAREAQVEASLERVRASAMAMHRSDELSDVLSILFEQFDILNIRPVDVHLDLFDLEKNTFSYRATGKEGTRVIAEQIVDLDSRPEWQSLVERWKKGKPNTVDFSYYPKEVIRDLMDFFPDIWASMPPEAIMIPEEDFPDGIYDALGYCKFGFLGFHHNRKTTEEENGILIRFTNEFERLYQRFLDLQKAEAQAREAQIEAALEKVRSRSLAMHTSREFQEVVNIIIDMIKSLRIETDVAMLLIPKQDSKHMTTWFQNKDNAYSEGLEFTYFEKSIISQDILRAWESRDSNFSKCYSKKEKDNWYSAAFKSNLKDIPEDRKQYILSKQGMSISLSFSNHIGILVYRYTQDAFSDDDNKVIKRFAKVFEQTYTRFLDLQKAEAQAREAANSIGIGKGSLACNGNAEFGRIKWIDRNGIY